MSPLSVRRYRAERLLRKEFEALRAHVLANVRSRLRAAGVSLDEGDLEGCYATAWHGLYMAMLEGGEEIANPAGWLTVVTHRRALDEHRARSRLADEPSHELGEPERDLVQELDDRARLRWLMEGLRGRLGAREREAAALCYLQGLSRSEAAARMGISEGRMRKLMEGSRPGVPGVAAKVGELLQSIRAGSFCAEQSSLMRAFAFGILDPHGERHELARAHQRDCPACRAYVLSLRGLASVLPLPPLPFALGLGLAAGAGAGATGAGAGSGAASAGAGAGGGAAGAGGTAGVATAGAAGTAGASGGWLLAGGIGAKLAVGCALAVGLGAGCVALTLAPIAPHRHDIRRRRPVAADARAPGSGAYAALSLPFTGTSSTSTPAVGSTGGPASAAPAAGSSRLTPQAKATREFGPEQPAGAATASTTIASRASRNAGVGLARTASAGTHAGSSSGAGGELPVSSASPSADRTSGRSSTSGATSPAEREFSPG
jgi:RNA polymerase sigma factor (sigma-70 family)